MRDGGVAFLRMAAAVEKEAEGQEGDARTALFLLASALEVPVRQIATAIPALSWTASAAVRTRPSGFDAATLRFGDLLEAGIIDATKVVRVALENAVSVAGTLLLTDATMTEIREEKEEPRPEFE